MVIQTSNWRAFNLSLTSVVTNMYTLNVGVSDKIMMPWLKNMPYMDCSDEGEAVAIGAGYFLATGKKANVFMSADGFCNALNFLTSWVIPEKLRMNIVISTGRQEAPHKVMSDILSRLILLIPHDPDTLSFEFVQKES